MPTFLPPHDSRLKERSSEVPEDMILSKEIQDLIDHMFKVAAGERGDPSSRGMVGLAAPQIGVFKRIILVDIGVDTKRRTWGEIKIFINPRIIEQSSDTHIDREGCFSVDSHVCGLVPRATWIKVAYLDRDGKAQCEEYTDYTARIFQHEIDHLDGIRFPDRVGQEGQMHWVEPDQYPEYRQSWQHWSVLFPWEGWIAMQEGEPYGNFK